MRCFPLVKNSGLEDVTWEGGRQRAYDKNAEERGMYASSRGMRVQRGVVQVCGQSADLSRHAACGCRRRHR